MRSDIAKAVVELLGELAPGLPGAAPSIRLDEAGIDSLTVAEMAVHLELRIARPVPDGALAAVQDDPRFAPSMTVEDLAEVVADVVLGGDDGTRP